MSFHQTIYLDKEFISDLYEEVTGNSPEVNITKSEGLKAGARVPIFSANVSSTETKSYKISTSKMLSELEKTLSEYETLNQGIGDQINQCSKYLWISGSMTVQKTTVSTQKKKITINENGLNKQNVGDAVEKAKESYFSIRDTHNNSFPLLANADYFLANISDLIGITGTVINMVDFKVDALLRVLPVKTSFDGWVAVPLIIREAGS